MNESYNTEITEFCLEGRFLDFVIKDGYKLKGLLLATAEGECYVKLAKHLRAAFDLRLPPGTWLQVVGTKKYDQENGTFKLKAERIMAARTEINQLKPPSSVNNTNAKSAKTKATILVCQKSDCMRRGAREVCQAVETALAARGLEEQVTIRGTGCMKNCQAGPNIVMPDKTRYSRIKPAQISALIDQHISKSSSESVSGNSEDLAINVANFVEATR